VNVGENDELRFNPRFSITLVPQPPGKRQYPIKTGCMSAFAKRLLSIKANAIVNQSGGACYCLNG
jgi:hypothetical protein